MNKPKCKGRRWDFAAPVLNLRGRGLFIPGVRLWLSAHIDDLPIPQRFKQA